MAYGEHHLVAYDPNIGRSREFTAEELSKARGREPFWNNKHPEDKKKIMLDVCQKMELEATNLGYGILSDILLSYAKQLREILE